MNRFKEINTILPLEILLRIFNYLSLTELIELSKVNSYYMQLAKIIYIEKVIKNKLIVEINLGTEQSINIRYECTRFNRENEQTVWKPQAVISTENQRSVNTKEKVILKKIYFDKEPQNSGKFFIYINYYINIYSKKDLLMLNFVFNINIILINSNSKSLINN